MRDVVIVCAGGFGQEVYYMIQYINQNAGEKGKEVPYHILGFIDDNPDALKGSGISEKIIGTIRDWKPFGEEVYALGVASPKTKEKIAVMLKERGCKFVSLVSPRSLIDGELKMGEGCIVSAYSIGNNVTLGNFVNVMGTMVGQTAEIGDYSTTTGFANITTAKLGKRVFVGSHAVIMNDRKIGDDAFICVGSVVVSNVKPGTKVFGIPARKVDW